LCTSSIDLSNHVTLLSGDVSLGNDI